MLNGTTVDTNVTMTQDSADIDREVESRTIGTAFEETVHARADELALRWRVDGDRQGWTWREYADRVARVAAGLRELGVERGKGPCS